MVDHNSLFTNVVLILGFATVVASLFYLLKFPPIVGFLFSGVLIGPGGLALVDSTSEVETLTEIASVLLLFTLGLEFRWRTVFSLRKLLVNLGLAQVVITASMVATITFLAWHLPFAKSIFVGLLVAMSSTAAVLKLLHDQRHLETPFGKASMGILISQDLVVIFVLTLLPLLSETGFDSFQYISWAHLGGMIFRGASVVAIVTIGTRYFVPQFLNFVGRSDSREVFFVSIVFVCMFVALIMQKLGLSLSLGAFCAGVMIAETPYGHQTMADVTPFRDSFIGLFFVAIGMLLSMQYVAQHGLEILGYMVSIFLIKAFVIAAIMWWLGNPVSMGVATGLILAQVGEFSFVLVDQGLRLGLMDENGRQLFLSISIGLLALSPLFYRLAIHLAFNVEYDQILPIQIQNIAHGIRQSLIREPFRVNVHATQIKESSLKADENHVIIVGFGIAAQQVAILCKSLEIPYCILETNKRTVNRYKDSEPIVVGDATQRITLVNVHLERAKMVVIAVTGAVIAGAIHRAVRQIHPTIPVLLRAQYLRDLSQMSVHNNTQIVFAEFEGTLALLTQTLATMGVEKTIQQKFLDEARQSLEDQIHS